MEAGRTLMAVFAHPDDEVWTGAAMAKYGREGVRTVLVTATRGEEGEIRDPDLDVEEARPRLADIREQELRASARIFGIDQLDFLGYRDSGMVGTEANAHPANFHNAPLEEATARLVRIIRRERPQVLITDNERGTYGHPDHIAAHRTTVAAFEAAGDPDRFPEAGAAWQPQKLYYTAFPRSAFVRLRQMLDEHGLSWGDGEAEVEDALDFTVPDDQITTWIEIGPYLPLMRQSMRAHRTQITADDPFLNIPDEVALQVMHQATFTRARSRVEAPVPEHDLFAGLE